MSDTPTPRTDAKVRELESEEDHYYSDMIDHARQLETDLQHLARVAGEAAKPITMQDVRLCTGEGKLKPDHVLRAANIILKQRLSEIQRIKEQTK